MRRSTLLAVSITALVLIVAGQWPAIVGDTGIRGVRHIVSNVLAWRPPPRIAAPRPEAAAEHRSGPTGLAPEALAALGVGGGVAVCFALWAGLSWTLRPRPSRRRQPLDAERWLARDARAAH